MVAGECFQGRSFAIDNRRREKNIVIPGTCPGPVASFKKLVCGTFSGKKDMLAFTLDIHLLNKME